MGKKNSLDAKRKRKELKRKKKKSVLVSQGHYYLFRATGIYYINQLSETFEIDLIVPKEYQDIPEFYECLKFVKIRKVYYLDDTIYFKKSDTFISKVLTYLSFFNVKAHLRLKKISLEILKNNYAAYFSHDYIETEHIYLFHMFRRFNEGKPIISLISSQPSNENIIPGFKQIKNKNAKRISFGIPIIHQISLLILYFLRYLQSFFQNIFYPMLVGQIFPPYLSFSAFNNIDIVPRKGFFDLQIVYEEIEAGFYEDLFKERVKVEKVNHPINCNQSQLMSDLYGEKNTKEKNISIFFSTLGIIPEHLDSEVSTWMKLINQLLLLEENIKISVKFHPRMDSNTINYTSMKILELFKKKITIFTGSSTTAEELIFNSQIIIGDVSSTLIWAQYFHDKKVFSLALPGFINNTDMRRYPKIHVTSDFNEIVRTIKDTNRYNSGANLSLTQAPTLNELMLGIIK